MNEPTCTDCPRLLRRVTWSWDGENEELVEYICALNDKIVQECEFIEIAPEPKTPEWCPLKEK